MNSHRKRRIIAALNMIECEYVRLMIHTFFCVLLTVVVAAENGPFSWRPCAMPESRQMSSLTFVNNIISNPFVRSLDANFIVFLYNLAS